MSALGVSLLHPGRLAAQTCDPADLTCQEPPSVSIDPPGQYWSGTAQSMVLAVHAEFCKAGTYPFAASGETITLDGQPVQGFTNSTVVNGCYTSSGNVTLTAASHTLAASKSGGGRTGTASETYVYAIEPPPSVTAPALVEPAGGTAYVANSSSGQVQSFTVWNGGTGSAAYTLTATCEGAATACTASAGTVTLAASASAQVGVTYGLTGTAGRVRLTAVRSSGETSTGWIDVQVATFSVSSPIRHLCVTVALPGDAASECGDLRLAHALPAARTMNRARAPVLLYNSALAEPRLRLVQSLTATASKPPLDSVWLTVTLANGTSLGRQRWAVAPGTWPSGEIRRLVYTADLSTLATGVYAATLETTGWRSGVAAVLSQPFEFIFVNRAASRFGAGWWVAGLESIQHLADGRKLWVGGDGSAMVYLPLNDSTWIAVNPERPDTLRKRVNPQGAIRYVRLLPGGAHLVFGATGAQDSTVNRLGQVTTFGYGANGLDSIAAPGGVVYRFEYGGGTPRLWRVRLESGGATRVVEVGAQDGDARIRTLLDPDGAQVTFGYDGTGRRIVRRMDRRGTWSSYGYDGAGKVVRGQLEVGAAGDADDIIVRITPGESRGASPLPARFDSVYTLVDGPRPDGDARDVLRMWIPARLDSSTPERIVDALGGETVLTYGDTRFRGRVTRVDGPVLADGTRSSSTATYDARGNPQSSVAVNPLRDGRDATTRYEHGDAAWPDFVTRVISPMGEVTQTAYDPATGNRLWQQPGTDAARRVSFSYRPANDAVAPNLPASTTYPAGAGQSGPTVERYEYDARGNLNAVQSPLGARSESRADALGQDTLERRQITATATDTTWEVTRHRYDAVGQDTLTETVGPAMNGHPEQRLIVRTRRDPEGNVLSVRRQSLPDTTHLDSVVTRFAYDAAGRMVRETAPDGKADTTAYDLGSNAIWTLTRRGDLLRTRYDALNRPLVRYHSATAYAAERRGIPSVVNRPPAYCPDSSAVSPYDIYHPYPYYPNAAACGYVVPADSSMFEYDPMGRLIRADNADALVRRSYFPGGLLERETLKIQTAARDDSTRHVYGLDYGYDLDGRRTSLTHPTALAPAGGVPTRYTYHPVTGALETVTDPLGNVFRYGYDNGGQLSSLRRGQYVLDAYLYDDDGRLRQYDLDLPAALGGRVSQTHLTYDRRGKMLRSENDVGMQDLLLAEYSGLGHLVRSSQEATGITNGMNVKIESSSSTYAYDALGNGHRTTSFTGSSTQDSFRHAPNTSYGTKSGASAYAPLTGRLLTATQGNNTEQFAYDFAGNTVFQWGADTQQNFSDMASYYGADGRLRTVDRRSLSGTGSSSVWEEYRYDALGRRVWVRTLNRCDDAMGMCGLDLVRRTVWDGDQALYEIQMQASEQENDGVPAQIARIGIDQFDPNPLTGRVLHTFGPGIDQPLSTIRLAFANRPEGWGYQLWQPFAVIPVWDNQGRAPYLLFSNGTRRRCEGDGRCLDTEWILGWRAYGSRSNAVVKSTSNQNAWLGNVLEDHHDASGLLYRRNRYYNPQTGRFTQEDPIGLAGGVNAYGFAAGDPVGYSDSYGLSAMCNPPTPECLMGEAWNAVGRRLDAARRTLLSAASFAGPTADANDFGTVATGYDALNGERVNAGGRVATIVGAALPIVGGAVLRRLGTSYESASRLARKAAEAEEHIGIHGVSVTENQVEGASSASRAAVEQHFPVHNTGTRRDPLHRTVELPKPVTKQVADLFNSLFGRP